MSARRIREDMGVGEDSFLDTTANLVGILIILVVVIGTKTKIDAEEYGRQLATADATPKLEEPQREARALLASLQKQKLDSERYVMETEYRRQERDKLLEQVALQRARVDEQLQGADQLKLETLEKQKQAEKLTSELRQVEQQMGQAEESQRPEIVLEHLPTPMAKTVFTREMHIRLAEGRVTVIPWDRLVSLLREQVPLAARRKASRGNLEDALGPVGGFLMRYRMEAVPGGFELERFELEPTDAAPSESMPEALAPAGRLRLELASRDPSKTVVTVWVYPDSFEEFRQLKARLFEEGFLSAARPIPQGVRIGASPRGTRSSAQ